MTLTGLLIPLALKCFVAVGGAVGVCAAIKGSIRMKDANGFMESIQEHHEVNLEILRRTQRKAAAEMDKLGELELIILDRFKEFQDVLEQVEHRPVFPPYYKDGITLSKYDGAEIKKASVGAGILLEETGGAEWGAVGGFAAAGAATAALTAFKTASTCTAIASPNGVSVTNMTLTAMSAGVLDLGENGGGTAVLGMSKLGVGFLVGGLLFNSSDTRLFGKASEAVSQVFEAKEKIDRICFYLEDLVDTSNRYYTSLYEVNKAFERHLEGLKTIVTLLDHKDWNTFTDEEKGVAENTVLLVGLLYNMCKVKLVLKAKHEEEVNTINSYSVEASMHQAERILQEHFCREAIA